MDKYFVLEGMNYLKLHNGISTACALSAAILILPVLAYADHDSGKGNKGDNDRQRWGERDEHRWGDHDRDRDRDVPVVPEANAGWVLVPFFGAVLLFSARHLFGAKEAKDS
jgi:hypothetical protein